jgi:hypothetical protein
MRTMNILRWETTLNYIIFNKNRRSFNVPAAQKLDLVKKLNNFSTLCELITPFVHILSLTLNLNYLIWFLKKKKLNQKITMQKSVEKSYFTFLLLCYSFMKFSFIQYIPIEEGGGLCE